jgi:hypothetical protein
MPTGKGSQIEGTNPIGTDGPGGPSDAPDVKKYHTYLVEDTNHTFSAPYEKYKDLTGDLGLKDIDDDKTARENAVRLRQGTGFINIKCRTEAGATISLVCSPSKLGSAIKNIRNNKVYGEDIVWSYIPKKVSYR